MNDIPETFSPWLKSRLKGKVEEFSVTIPLPPTTITKLTHLSSEKQSYLQEEILRAIFTFLAADQVSSTDKK